MEWLSKSTKRLLAEMSAGIIFYNVILVILAVLLLTAVILAAKVYFLHRSAEEIAKAFHDIRTSDTNTLISVSSRDRICGGLLRISISNSVCSAKNAGAASRGIWN